MGKHGPASTDPAEFFRYVFLERPRCPRCRSASLKTTRSERHGDEAVTRHTTCRACKWHFFVIVE